MKPTIETANRLITSALGEQHSDAPTWPQRRFLISMFNAPWSSAEARQNGLVRLAIASMGTVDAFNEQLFVHKMVETYVTKLIPALLREAASSREEPAKSSLLKAATRCEIEVVADLSESALMKADDRLAFSAAQATRELSTADDPGLAKVLVWANCAGVSATEVAFRNKPLRARSLDSAAQWAANAACAAAKWLAATSGDQAAADRILTEWTEAIVQVLVTMNTAGSFFLSAME